MVMPTKQPTDQDRKLVTTMIAGGIEQKFIMPCLSFRCSPTTFRKHFREEIRTAKARANAAVVANLHRHATGDGREAVYAAKWWTQARMGWKEPAQEIANAPGGPFAVAFSWADATPEPAGSHEQPDAAADP
jgi:hypothetical protein